MYSTCVVMSNCQCHSTHSFRRQKGGAGFLDCQIVVQLILWSVKETEPCSITQLQLLYFVTIFFVGGRITEG